MTTIYDPNDQAYLDEASVRNELTRVFDICHGCRRCVEFCTSFPTLFAMLDGHADHDAGLLTPDQQDQVVDECFQCKLCHVNCPYTPELHEWQLDFPRLMLRSQAMRSATGQQPIRRRRTTQILGRTDLIGNVATTAPIINRIVNRLITAPRGSRVRTMVAKVTGVSSVRLLPPFAPQRFSTWFKKRTNNVTSERQSRVTIFPTCLVEYQATQIGKDLIDVYERNGIECSGTRAGCCGAPWLHAGDLDHFTEVASKNVKILADEVRRVGDIVVPQPTCGYVLKHDYVDHIGGADAQLVAEHTYDAAEYLMKVHHEDAKLDTAFHGVVPSLISYLAASQLLAQNIGLPGRDLLRLTGADVEVVQQRSGIAGMWGRRAENDERSMSTAEQLATLIEAAAGDVVAGDCSLANTVILEQTGVTSSHPIQLIARAYGIPEPT